MLPEPTLTCDTIRWKNPKTRGDIQMDGDLAIRTQATGLTRDLAARASAVSYDALPGPVRALARQCVLDYYGVALAGAADPLVRILLDEANDAGGAPQASVIADAARLPVLAAALVNGA